MDERARGAAREWEWRTRFFFYEEIFFVGKNAVCKINFFQTDREMQLTPAIIESNRPPSRPDSIALRFLLTTSL